MRSNVILIDVSIHKIPMAGPSDVSSLKNLFEIGEVDPENIIAILAKTEGNGCVNDFSRGLATMAFKKLLSNALDLEFHKVSGKVAFVMSGGTEGAMSPHATVFTRKDTPKKLGSNEKSLSVSVGFTRDIEPEEIGKISMVKEVSETVKRTIEDAEIQNADDVHFVQIKCPLLTSEKIQDAKKRNEKVVTEKTYESMGYSRGASALGVALALGEITEGEISQEKILEDWSLNSEVASTSAGVELSNVEIIVMGNSEKSQSDLRISHSVMKDSIDSKAVLESLRKNEIEFEGLPDSNDLEKVVNVFAKAEADPSGEVRGRRTTMLTDSDINPTRHARAVVNSVIAGIVGDPMVYVSGGAEHQGPSGGGPVASIVEK